MATPDALTTIKRLQAVAVRNHRDRQKQLAELRRGIKKTMFIIALSALLIATLADILSIFDIGWVVSWAIPPICWVIVRRITQINKNGDAIVKAHTSAQRQLVVLCQRLHVAPSAVNVVSWKAKSYVGTFVRDTAITQLFELIPILDWLPTYIGQVVKVIIDQNRAYKQANILIPALERIFQTIEKLEQLELQYQARQITEFIRAQQLIQHSHRRSIAQQSPTVIPALRFAT